MSRWRPYMGVLVTSFVSPCGCMTIDEGGLQRTPTWIVCATHAKRVKEIVAKRKPLVGEPLEVRP